MIKSLARFPKRKKNSIKTIAVCSSAAFFKEAVHLGRDLKKLGFGVSLPLTAYKMEKNNNYDVSFYKIWQRDASLYKRKTFLIRHHFRKIISSDAVLIVNLSKDGKKGYIGANTLMEIGIAFHYRKPIFILEDIPPDSPFYEELLGMSAVFIQGDLKRIG